MVDLKQAARNCYGDIKGDWHRDPWGWPEINWIATEREDLAYEHLTNGGAFPPALLDVPKENFILRPAVVLDPLDRLCYQSLVDRQAAKLIGGLNPAAYGWRLHREAPAAGQYESQAKEWDAYRQHIEAVGVSFDAALQTDIVSYFASIDVGEIVRRLQTLLGAGSVVDRLIDMIEVWGRTPGRSGIVQRALPSSVLANMFLRPVDDVLSKYNVSASGEPASALRWVDDIWVFGKDEGTLRSAQVDIQFLLATLGLHLNGAKTRILTGEDLARAIRENEHSGVDAAINQAVPDHGPLNELIDRILSDPENAPRTSVRFATTRMRHEHAFGRASEFIESAHRMPHVADHIARLIRDEGSWPDHVDWFLGYASSEWAVCEWPIAQLGTMFPARGLNIPKSVVDLMSTWINPSSSIALLALGAHRLSHWRRTEARLAIDGMARTASASWQRRILGLAGLQAGQHATWVRKLLGAMPETSVTLELLLAKAFRPLRTAGDYD